jgi:hypothetical protein
MYSDNLVLSLQTLSRSGLPRVRGVLLLLCNTVPVLRMEEIVNTNSSSMMSHHSTMVSLPSFNGLTENDSRLFNSILWSVGLKGTKTVPGVAPAAYFSAEDFTSILETFKGTFLYSQPTETLRRLGHMQFDKWLLHKLAALAGIKWYDSPLLRVLPLPDGGSYDDQVTRSRRDGMGFMEVKPEKFSTTVRAVTQSLHSRTVRTVKSSHGYLMLPSKICPRNIQRSLADFKHTQAPPVANARSAPRTVTAHTIDEIPAHFTYKIVQPRKSVQVVAIMGGEARLLVTQHPTCSAAGLAAFAAKDYEEGEFICMFLGELCNQATIDARAGREAYAMTLSYNKYGTNKNIIDPLYVPPHDTMWAHCINEPGRELHPISNVIVSPCGGIFANRDILKYEELLLSYNRNSTDFQKVR